MHPIRLKKLTMLLTIMGILALALALVLYALRQNISLFYTPSQVSLGEVPLNHAVRLGGMVNKGSLHRGDEPLAVEFTVTDFAHEVTILYQGILPDLFREGQGVVVDGELLPSGQFKATRVLAKHDEKYMPPEVKNSLKGKMQS